jgi:O-antigen/teichoic acid export membrane protein
MQRDLRLKMLATGSLEVLAAAVAVIFAPQILGLLYGEAYRAGAPMLRLAFIYWIASGFGCWYWIAFTAIGHPGLVMVPNILYAVVLVVVTLLLLSFTSLGVASAIVAQGMAHTAWFTSYEVLFRARMKGEIAKAALPEAG